MLRDKSLIPLSHQHQHALSLCVRVDRAAPIPDGDLETWQTEIVQQFEQEIKIHFLAEENALFPAARQFPELISLVEELQADHQWLLAAFSKAETYCMSAADLSAFALRLSAHIRKEERQLFESLQKLMNPGQLANLGLQLQDALKDATQACALPNEATKLRPAKN
jgi:hemerythrin-like domain-containing protein